MRVFKVFLLLALVGTGFMIFWVGAIVFTPMCIPLIWMVYGRDRERRVAGTQRLIKRWFGVFCSLIRTFRLVDVDPRRLHASAPQGGYVLVANHPTLIDVIALMAAYERICCVVKSSHIHNGLFGAFLRLAGFIDGGGSDASVPASDVLTDGLDRLSRGYGVLIFPEGTRSPPGSMHPFHRGPFELAARAKVPLVPVHIHVDPPVLGKGVPWYQFPKNTVAFEMKQLPPIMVGPSRAEIRSAMEEVRDLLLSRAHDSSCEPDRHEDLRDHSHV